MKNFPHQVAAFGKLRAGLTVVSDLANGPGDPSKDGDVGYEMVRRRLIEFRDTPAGVSTSDLEARIRLEQAKPAGNQGPRTTARDIRRTLRLLGWLDRRSRPTAEGRALLATRPDSAEERAILGAALLRMVITDPDGSAPHRPVLTLLRLLASAPSRRRAGLELALEPRDDSASELRRIRALYVLPASRRLGLLGITAAQRANAVKILPSLAVAAGFVAETGELSSLTLAGAQALGIPSTATTVATRRRVARITRATATGTLVTSTTVAPDRVPAGPARSLTAEEQEVAREKLRERTAAHQALVRRIARLIGDSRGGLFESVFSYDLLWVPSDASAAVLFEMKTVTTDLDAAIRARHALGQLAYYAYFSIGETVDGHPVEQSAVFDRDVPDAIVEFLTHHAIAVLVWRAGGDLRGLNPAGRALAGRLRPS